MHSKSFKTNGGQSLSLCSALQHTLVLLLLCEDDYDAGHTGEGHLRLECRPMIASRSLHRLAPLVRPPSGRRLNEATTYHTVRISVALSLANLV